jgi:hypothetical protein
VFNLTAKGANRISRESLLSQTLIAVLLSAVMIFGPTEALLIDLPLHLKAFAQESFLEICENLVDDDGDGFADLDDPEGCSADETGAAAPDQGVPPQDIITYPDGTTCDPNSQSCPPAETPAEDAPGMMTCRDGSVGTTCPPAETPADCDPIVQSCPPTDGAEVSPEEIGPADATPPATSTPTPTATANIDCISGGPFQIGGGVWSKGSSFNMQGGQLMKFELRNLNVLGTTITIDAGPNGKKSMILLPSVTSNIEFTTFGAEPMGWSFNIGTDSDAFLVGWKLLSSWPPGCPPNR